VDRLSVKTISESTIQIQGQKSNVKLDNGTSSYMLQKSALLPIEIRALPGCEYVRALSPRTLGPPGIICNCAAEWRLQKMGKQ